MGNEIAERKQEDEFLRSEMTGERNLFLAEETEAGEYSWAVRETAERMRDDTF